MKYLKLALLALVAVFATTSCMDDDWKDPNSETSPYGNNSIQETNVVSIAELKNTYGPKQKDEINDTVRIADGTQIKGIVTGNDVEGNIYSQISIQDDSDKPGIIISVAQGGLSGQLQIGQEVLINVGGLYYGTYRSQPQLGVAYHDSSKDQNYPSRISRADWQNRFKVIGKPDASKIKVKVFSTNPDTSKGELNVADLLDADVAYKYAGCLVTLKGVEFAMGDGKTTLAPEDEGKTLGYGVTRYFKGYDKTNKQIGIRTSCYAEFAANLVPQGVVDVTGVLSCYKSSAKYNHTVQLALRRFSDIKASESK
ncbi:DUF5689 domain-containing protein [Prevotella sp.]|uniref:DUF5689 domain-containing protein n=1 Tax=Prevotella sp. TaxID=59823 RepID=UPI002E7A0861|nr:DUF5689 domain-containing protein [Prevotella sp.]MEE0669996.1 DUF5689 domain-containing protein [Prevotella sp.]